MHVEFSFARCMAELVHQIFATKARWSLTFGDDRTGYIEIHAVDYKCARLSRVTGRPFIVLIPVYGLCGESWGRAFVASAATNGVDLSVLCGPMILRPDASGQLTKRYPWVNGILDRLIPNRPPGFTSQGVKATMLSWVSKAGMSEYDRRILGGHSTRGRQVVATYARDTLTAPVKGLEEFISFVPHGSFFPDASRSNMFWERRNNMAMKKHEL